AAATSAFPDLAHHSSRTGGSNRLHSSYYSKSLRSSPRKRGRHATAAQRDELAASYVGHQACSRPRLFCPIILSADKELFPPHRCRRSAGSGFHCRPDGPRRKEHIWDLWRTPGLLLPMGTPEAL